MRNNFAKRLYELRQEQALTQRELSRELGVSERTISYWERGERECDFDMLIKISLYFGVTLDYLLGKTDY
ncbi:MAG: helix-turn-helix transcriptional regulator [Clostridia bacterium]